MTDGRAMPLLGFAWHARMRPGAGSPGPAPDPVGDRG